MGAPLQIDADFRGGNVILDRIEGDRVWVHQDPRDTEGWWFYWHMRVRGAAGRTLTFTFTDGDCLGAMGPAASVDQGRSWHWLGAGAAEVASSFRLAFPNDAQDARLCLAVPYLQADWASFVRTLRGNAHTDRGVLCRSRKGRDVEWLRVGRLDGQAEHCLVLTCRHHCCEMMASYALEGFVHAMLADDVVGRWWRERAEVLIVPFVDPDGVEEGDQGKNRRPHDHYCDYAGTSVYPETAAIREFLPAWARGRLKVALDLHCPWIRGGRNEQIYLVGNRGDVTWAELTRFSGVLESHQAGKLRFATANNLPWGQDWNTYEGPLVCFAAWAETLPGVRFASTLELPYALAGGRAVTPANARDFGRDLATALKAYLE